MRFDNQIATQEVAYTPEIAWVLEAFHHMGAKPVDYIWREKVLPLWAYPNLALVGVMGVTLTGFLLYILALPIIHLFGG